MDELLSMKKAIRAQAMNARLELGESERAQKSTAICASIETIPQYTEAKSILFFMPFKGEVDISPLLHKAMKLGCKCALPKCEADRKLRLFVLSDLKCDITPGTYGIMEPKDCLSECSVDEFSVIIMPGVAFDRQGNRIGYGAGYYDRLLASAGKNILTIAPAFSLQIFTQVPQGCYDVPVDFVVTEEEIMDCRRAGGRKHG